MFIVCGFFKLYKIFVQYPMIELTLYTFVISSIIGLGRFLTKHCVYYHMVWLLECVSHFVANIL